MTLQVTAPETSAFGIQGGVQLICSFAIFSHISSDQNSGGEDKEVQGKGETAVQVKALYA